MVLADSGCWKRGVPADYFEEEETKGDSGDEVEEKLSELIDQGMTPWLGDPCYFYT